MTRKISHIVFLCQQVFHLRDIRWERPRFLSKSFLAFVTFNVISYSLLAAEVLTTNVADTDPVKKVNNKFDIRNYTQQLFHYIQVFFDYTVFHIMYCYLLTS